MKQTIRTIQLRFCQRMFASSALLGLLTMVVAGCTTLPRTPYSASESASSHVLDLTNLRRYADEPASMFRGDQVRPKLRGTQTYLALSGGGADGAYGAGVLIGWTEAGNRPSFSIVSGSSTGALIAPFAFLGPAYDGTLRDLYTSGVAESLLDSPNPLNALFGSGLFGNTRLRELVAKYIDRDFVSRVATEHAKGRLLFIVTTNLDAQRTAIWDMGRIAALETTAGLNLFRDVVAASASLPVVFPPMLISAESNGRRFEEMHVDGGVTAPVLTLPEAFLLQSATIEKANDFRLYVLINNKVEPEFQVVPNKTIEVAARSTATMVKTQTRSILFSTYEFARRNRFDFNLTYIEGDRSGSSASAFDTAYMRSLFDYGYARAQSGRLWSKAPPSDAHTRPSGYRVSMTPLLKTEKE